MSKQKKLLERLLSRPKDFTYQEAKTLLIQLGFVEKNKGKTSGSRVQFINNLYKIRIELHKPHPGNILRPYQIENIINKLGGIYNE